MDAQSICPQHIRLSIRRSRLVWCCQWAIQSQIRYVGTNLFIRSCTYVWNGCKFEYLYVLVFRIVFVHVCICVSLS